MLMTGMALGAGSEIAHQGVRGLMGSKIIVGEWEIWSFLGGNSGKDAENGENQNVDQSSQNVSQNQKQQGSCENETQSFIEVFSLFF